MGIGGAIKAWDGAYWVKYKGLKAAIIHKGNGQWTATIIGGKYTKRIKYGKLRDAVAGVIIEKMKENMKA